MFIPKDRKFKKDFKGNQGHIPNITYTGCSLDKGDFGIKAISPGRMTDTQMEAERKVIAKTLNKTGKIFRRVCADKPITKKAAETRMGGGKGSVEEWVMLISPGRILFEILGTSEEAAKKAFEAAAFKLPMRVKFVKRII